MTGAVKELRRRWLLLYRILASVDRVIVRGRRPALWVYDSIRAPDGYSLRRYVEAIARSNGLNLVAFGLPTAMSLAAVASMATALPVLLASNFDERLANLIRRRIAYTFHSHRCEVLLVGAAKGFYASHALGLVEAKNLWEVQHGLLHESYFPIEAGRFFTRSTASAAFLEREVPFVQVERLANDLDAPAGIVEQFDPRAASLMIVYSKCPGGGCTAEDLATFESACIRMAQSLKIPFQLRLHPRDRIRGLVARHRSLRPCAYLWNRTRRSREPSGRLLVSSYSTSLATESERGDRLLNVRLGEISRVVESEYAWLPSVSLQQLTKSATSLLVLRRT